MYPQLRKMFKFTSEVAGGATNPNFIAVKIARSRLGPFNCSALSRAAGQRESLPATTFCTLEYVTRARASSRNESHKVRDRGSI
jgi:hypothetical protein